MCVELLEKETLELFPKVLPYGWYQLPDTNTFLGPSGLRVIASAELVGGKRWWHVSLSHTDRLPSWDTVKLVKGIFIGKDKLAFQVLPPDDNYINVHSHCLHLWHCLDGDPVPDMRRPGGI